jgi:hypothetical protein
MRRQHRIARDSAPAAGNPAARSAKYLWAVFPWIIVAAFIFLVMKLIAAVP